LEQHLLTHQQDKLLTIAQSVIRQQAKSNKYLPCFALLLDGQGKIQEFIPSCEPGQEQQVFAEIIDNLKREVASGAICTALAIFLEPSTDGSDSGVTIDLEQHGEQRMIGFLQFSTSGSVVKFHDPSFTAKPSVLFRAA
jgi:hypothetical protein